jgi:hypothetical protein
MDSTNTDPIVQFNQPNSGTMAVEDAADDSDLIEITFIPAQLGDQTEPYIDPHANSRMLQNIPECIMASEEATTEVNQRMNNMHITRRGFSNGNVWH